MKLKKKKKKLQKNKKKKLQQCRLAQIEDDKKRKKLEELREKKWERLQLERFKKENEELKEFEKEQQNKKTRFTRIPWKIIKKSLDEKIKLDELYKDYIIRSNNPLKSNIKINKIFNIKPIHNNQKKHLA